MKNNGLLTKISAAVLCAALICSSISLTAAANSRVPIWDNGTSGSTAPFSEFLTAAGNAVTVSGTSVTLNDNIEIDYGLEIDGNYSLDLNGYGILYTDDGYNSVITVRQGCTFVLNDSRPSNVNYLEFDITQSRAIRIADQGGNGRLTVNGGFIAGGTGKAATGVVYGYVRFGGGVLMEPNAGFIMNGGTICGNGALPERQNTGRYIYYDLEGAGVYMYGSDTFKMTGGEIRDNNTSRSSVSVSGTFEMTGGKIFDNDNYYSDNSFDGVVYSRGSVIRVSAHAYISGDYINIQSSNEPITVTGRLYSDAYLCVYTENNEDRTVAFGGAGYSVSSSDALKFHSYYGSDPAGTVIDGGVRFHEVLSPEKLVLSPDSMIYTGDPVTLGVIYDGSALNGSRYTLTYAKNGASVDQLKETGTYSVTVTGRNHYSGSVTKNFVINLPYNMPEPTFTVTNSGSTFTVTRSVSWKAQTVYYRTVGLSAIAGVHFTDASGTLTFDVGETSKTVTVTELSNFGTVFKYQSGTSRTYRFEVLDEGGFRLAYKNKSVSCGSSTSVVASDFEVKNVTVFTDTVSVTDGGYDQAYHDVPVSSGYFGAYAAKEYLTATGAQLRMTVSFNAREKDDGYQYIQIYANDTTHVDTGAKDGDPGTLEYSYYMAGFTIDGNVSSTYYPYVFPLTSKGNACGSQTHPWSGNEKGNLEQQYFKSGQRASDGRLIIPTNLNSLRIRFDASGNINDTWYVKDAYANIQAIDTAAPTLYNNTTSYITISSGPYMTGNTVYVSVPFSEIVAVTGTPSLSTTWGTLSYISGSGSNVLTFAGLISASVGTTLRLKSISGTVKDLSGNQFTAYSAVSKRYSLAVAESFAFPVVYDLDGGSLPSGQSNPGTYTFTDTFTLATPVKDGHIFAGWVGTDLAERTYTVTVPAGEHKNRYYKAEWRPVISFVDYDGTELASYDFEINDVPEYTGETPTRADDVTAGETVTYAFAGWSDGVSEYRALPAVTGPVTYTATYDLSHYYLITFENHDGTILQQSWVLEGTTPVYTGETPAKTSTTQYDFIFTGWDKQPAAVTGSETYTAVYSNDLRQYTVTFKNYDGTVLQSGPVYYGGTPAYSGETPSRPASGSVTGYFFAGWSPEISAVTGAAEYTARFDALYTGTFGDGFSWTLFQGTLTVSGSGNMPNFGSYDNTPWYNYSKSITAVVIEGGITNVSNYAFSNFNNITSVTLCEGVKSVGMYAFRNCRSLNTVYLPRSMKTISNDAFDNDSALLADNGGNVYYAGSQTEWNGMRIRNGNGPLTGANRHYALLSVDATDSLTPSRQIICSTSGAAENDTVTVTVKTADGVTCTGVTVTYDGNRTLQATAGADGVWTFTMPAYDVTVTAYCAGTPVTTLSIGDNSVYFGYTINSIDYGFTPDRSGWYVFSYAGGNGVAIRIFNGFDYACTVASSNYVESFSVPVYLNGGQTYAIQLLTNGDFVDVINVSRNVPLYAVNAAPDPHGVVDATSIEGTPLFSAPAGFEVYLKAYPDEGYKLSGAYYDEQFTVLDGAGNEVPINFSSSECYFTMPASPVTVSANYEEDIRYPVTVVVDEGVTEYKLYDYDNNRYFISEPVKPGTRIMLDVFTFDDYEIISVTPDDFVSDIWEKFCEMPDHPLTVTVITRKKDMPSLSVGDNVIGESAGDMYSFTPAQSGAYVLTTDAEGSLYYNIYSFADDHRIGSKYDTNGVGLHGGHTYFITLSAPAGTLTVTRLGDASFEYNVTVSQTAGGTVTAECAKANYNDMIKLTADPEPGYVFTGFVCTDRYGDPVEAATLRGEYYLAMPFSDVTVTARWRRLSFDTASVTLQNDLKINFKVRNEFFASGDCSAPYAIFEMNGRTVTVRDHETTIVNGKEYLVFSFLNVAPDMMNETITATLCASMNGTEIRSTPVTYSISQYCRDLLGVTENRRLKTLLVDMLNYGAATQTYTGRGTDNLANKDLTDGQRGLGTQAEPALTAVTNTKYREVQSPEARWKAASLSLNDSITMQFKFSLDDMTGVTVVVEDENGVIDTVPADKISEIGGLRVVRLNGYTATQMRDPVYLTVCRDGLPISNTFAYSIESYAYAKKNDADENLAALVIAMMKYGIASAAYKG